MQKSRFIQHYNELLKAFEQHFSKTLKGKGIEDIHQMRVTIKKLRAIWMLMDSIFPNETDQIDHSKVFNPLFKQSGIVRETQVHLSMLKKNKAHYLESYKAYQRKIQKRASNKLHEIMVRFHDVDIDPLEDARILRIKNTMDPVVYTKSSVLSRKKLKRVKTLLEHSDNNSKLHNIRMHLKVVAELLYILIEIKPTKRLRRLYRKIKSVNHKIGKWHDYYVLHRSLIKFKKTELRKKSQRYYENLMLRIEIELNERENNVIQVLQKLYAPKPKNQINLFEKF